MQLLHSWHFNLSQTCSVGAVEWSCWHDSLPAVNKLWWPSAVERLILNTAGQWILLCLTGRSCSLVGMQPQSNNLSSRSNCPAVADTYDILLSSMSTAQNIWFCNVQSSFQEASLRTRWVTKARQIVGEHFQCHFCDQEFSETACAINNFTPLGLKWSVNWGKIWQNLRIAKTVTNSHVKLQNLILKLVSYFLCWVH